MRKVLFLLTIFISQVIFSSQIELKKNNDITFLNDDGFFDDYKKIVVEDYLKPDDFEKLIDEKLYNKGSIKQQKKILVSQNIDLAYLFKNDIEEFFSSLDKVNQESLQKFLLNIVNGDIKITNEHLKQKVIAMIILELDKDSEEDLLSSIKNYQDKKGIELLLQQKEENEPFNEKKYPIQNLIEKFSKYFEDKDAQKAKEQILSLNISDINSNDDLSKMLNKIFIYNKFLGISNYFGYPDQVVKKLIDSSSISIESLNKAELKNFLTLFVRYDCVYGIKKIIDSDNFKNFSLEDVAKILIFIVNQYRNTESLFYEKFSFFMRYAVDISKILRAQKNNFLDLSYNQIILKLFYLKNNLQKMVRIFVRNYQEEALQLLFVLANLDNRYIPILIEASKCYKKKNFLYEKILILKDKVYDNGQTFLSTLILEDFFNDSKEELIELLNDALIRYNKPLVRSILYNALSNFSKDNEYIKQVRDKIDELIQKLSEEKNITPEQQNFINELKAFNVLKNDFSGLSSVDNAFYNAYLEYLKGNKQNLRNLVFPVSDKVYAIMPRKEFEKTALSMIKTSLKKIFKEDRIQFLLFDLAQGDNQQQEVEYLLYHMGLRNQPINGAVAANTKP